MCTLFSCCRNEIGLLTAAVPSPLILSLLLFPLVVLDVLLNSRRPLTFGLPLVADDEVGVSLSESFAGSFLGDGLSISTLLCLFIFDWTGDDGDDKAFSAEVVMVAVGRVVRDGETFSGVLFVTGGVRPDIGGGSLLLFDVVDVLGLILITVLLFVF